MFVRATKFGPVVFAAFLAACGNGSGGGDAGPDGGEVGAAVGTAVVVRVRAVVGARPFSCGDTYASMGRGGGATWEPRDFRFYVSNVRLLTDDGREQPLALEQDGRWQHQGVALLDFENAAGRCMGNADTRDTIVGRVPPGTYRGLRFSLSVPFAQNHAEPATAPAPLNDSALWWSWNAGYKFLRIDGNTMGLPMGFNIHLGATGCMGNNAGAVAECSAPNRAEVTIERFDPATQVLVADLARLVADVDLNSNTAMTAPGCMSGGDDPECAGIFRSLGLPFGTTAANPAGQTFFRAESSAP